MFTSEDIVRCPNCKGGILKFRKEVENKAYLQCGNCDMPYKLVPMANNFVGEEPKHFAIMSQFEQIGQMGCTWAASQQAAEADVHVEEPNAKLVLMDESVCPVCKDNG